MAVDPSRLALVVSNAGFGGYRPFVEVEPAVIDELIGVHVRAVARLTRAALPGMAFRMVERDLPEPGRHEVRIRVHACGVEDELSRGAC